MSFLMTQFYLFQGYEMPTLANASRGSNEEGWLLATDIHAATICDNSAHPAQAGQGSGVECGPRDQENLATVGL